MVSEVVSNSLAEQSRQTNKRAASQANMLLDCLVKIDTHQRPPISTLFFAYTTGAI